MNILISAVWAVALFAMSSAFTIGWTSPPRLMAGCTTALHEHKWLFGGADIDELTMSIPPAVWLFDSKQNIWLQVSTDLTMLNGTSDDLGRIHCSAISFANRAVQSLSDNSYVFLNRSSAPGTGVIVLYGGLTRRPGTAFPRLQASTGGIDFGRMIATLEVPSLKWHIWVDPPGVERSSVQSSQEPFDQGRAGHTAVAYTNPVTGHDWMIVVGGAYCTFNIGRYQFWSTSTLLGWT